MNNQNRFAHCKLIIQNVVAKVNVGGTLNCFEVVEILKARYDPQCFPAAVSISKLTATTQNLFTTGNLVVSGSKSIWQSLASAHLVVAKLANDMGRYDLKVLNYSVENIVACAYLGFSDFDVEKFQHDHSLTSGFNPQKFPGLYWRAGNGLGFVVFHSGRVVSTGSKTFDQLKYADECLLKLKEYSRATLQRKFYLTSKCVKKWRFNSTHRVIDVRKYNGGRKIKESKISALQADEFKKILIHDILTYNPPAFFDYLGKQSNKHLKLFKPANLNDLKYNRPRQMHDKEQ